ncbi:flagellar export chaperone FlgN [Athalassotoga saccharophila]|uniref:flagellar export chaperone FlgN n=1 Tax=Athalassotoga saccharophila TaxID=1441386 RepID=UPI0013799893|nr:flagellar export chaperone FlgN [Athalassotoga saccharophila]BBJ28023.1 hypothetical protein ATHSA_0923 [Athalassotoga saccharophila]
MVEELIKILEEEHDQFLDLADILKEKRDTIEKNDVERLKNVLEKERDKLRVLDDLEQKRLNLSLKITNDLKVEPTISAIINVIDEPLRHDLAIVVAKMTNVINEVSLINLGIQRMITYRLEEFDLIMNLFKSQDKTYDKTSHIPSGMIFNGNA